VVSGEVISWSARYGWAVRSGLSARAPSRAAGLAEPVPWKSQWTLSGLLCRFVTIVASAIPLREIGSSIRVARKAHSTATGLS
jgi:hypothetical protein